MLNPAHALALGMLCTQFPPSSWLYGLLYRLAVWCVAIGFYASGDLRSVYLRRSLAHGEVVYGLSDIDLCFVLEDGTAPATRDLLAARYRTLARRLPILDPAPEFFTLEELISLNETDPRYHYRFLEGRHGWSLLFGEDVIKTLDAVPGFLGPALSSELNTYVILWFRFRLGDLDTGPLQQRRTDYLYLKMILAGFRTALFLSTGRLVFRRREIEELLISRYRFSVEAETERLRRFVLFCRQHRFCRLFPARTELESDVLGLVLAVIRRLRGVALLDPGHRYSQCFESFFEADLFVPERRSVRTRFISDVTELLRMPATIRENRARDLETIAVLDDIVFHVSNHDPGTGYPGFLYMDTGGQSGGPAERKDLVDPPAARSPAD